MSLSISQLSASDADTLSSELVFMVDALPRFGSLQKEGRTLRKGAKFVLDDLRKKHIRYEKLLTTAVIVVLYVRFDKKQAATIPANKTATQHVLENQALKPRGHLQAVRMCDFTFRYIHDGSDVILDTFTLALTDGLNQETKVISVDIVPIDDQSPQLSQGLRPLLIVSEGDEAVITSRWVSYNPLFFIV